MFSTLTRQSWPKIVTISRSGLANKIPNPVVRGERLDQNWDEQQRAAYCAAAANLHAALIDALVDQETPEGCTDALVKALDDRVPNDPTLVEMEPPDLEIKSFPLPAISRLSSTAVTSRATAAGA